MVGQWWVNELFHLCMLVHLSQVSFCLGVKGGSIIVVVRVALEQGLSVRRLSGR